LYPCNLTTIELKAAIIYFNVSEAIIFHDIKSYTELLALAKTQKDCGKTNLAEFILNKGSRKVEEIISTA